MGHETENSMLFNNMPDYVEPDEDELYEEHRQRLIDDCAEAERKLFALERKRSRDYATQIADDLVNLIKEIGGGK